MTGVELTKRQEDALGLLRQARGAPVVLPASTGARLVELGLAKPAQKASDERVPFGYGTFAATPDTETAG